MKDGKFETQKEIFEALLRGDKIILNEMVDYVYLGSDGTVKGSDGCLYDFAFNHPSNWSIYKEPKKKKTIEVKFYRYHLCCNINYFQYGWTTATYDKLNFLLGTKLLKTEERVEIYEVDDD